MKFEIKTNGGIEHFKDCCKKSDVEELPDDAKAFLLHMKT